MLALRYLVNTEAECYLALGLIKGPLIIRNANYKNLKGVIYPLIKANAKIEIMDDRIIVYPSILEPMDIKTDYYPGFPTDLEQIFAPVLVKYGGTIVETIFENRFMHADELRRMGANIKIDGRNAIVEGVPRLTGCKVKATDLRDGAALIIAALVAEGQTEITELHHIDRGYEDLSQKFQTIGADIVRVNDADEEA